jgi:hypothetical protein
LLSSLPNQSLNPLQEFNNVGARSNNISDWSPADVRVFIERLGWIGDRESMAKRFEDEEIDGAMLMELETAHFEKLGVKIGHQFRIRKMVKDGHEVIDDLATDNLEMEKSTLCGAAGLGQVAIVVVNIYIIVIPATMHYIQENLILSRDAGQWAAVGLWIGALLPMVAMWLSGSKIAAYVLEAADPSEIKENTRAIWTNVALVSALFITLVPGMLQSELPNTADEELPTQTLYCLFCITSIFFIMLSLVQCIICIVATEPLQPVAFAKFVLTYPNTPGEPAATLTAGIYAVISALMVWTWNAYTDVAATTNAVLLLIVCTHFFQIGLDKGAFTEHGSSWTRGHDATELAKNAGVGGALGVAKQAEAFTKFYDFIVENDSRSEAMAQKLRSK